MVYTIQALKDRALDDQRLSLNAKGLFCVIALLGVKSAKALHMFSASSKRATSIALDELRCLGYVRRKYNFENKTLSDEITLPMKDEG